MKEFPRRFLSLRDKNGASRRSKSASPGHNSRPLHSETLRSLFKTDHARTAAEDTDGKAEDAATIANVQRRLDELHITEVSSDYIRDILATKYVSGDSQRAAAFIDIEQKSASGIITPYDPSVSMQGAENRGGVTCFLDALLFAMFSKLDAFECMLKNDFAPEDPRSRLVNLLRIWVNMLRTGRLIRPDLTKLIQDALADCGWSDARMLEQQDTSEAFAFLTETLQLPLLSLQVDLFHHGKGDKDDHKVVYERLLNLAIPPDPEGKGIRLEDCLEEYFNTQVDVTRDSEEAKKSIAEDNSLGPSSPVLLRRNTIRLVADNQGEASTVMTSTPVNVSPTTHLPPQSPKEDMNGSSSDELIQKSEIQGERSQEASQNTPTHGSERRVSTRHRSTSIIQNMLVDEKGRSSSLDTVSLLQRPSRKGSMIVKAVTIPAWQFFRLIPWHAVTSNDPQSDTDVAMNFDQRPVVGVCLKRYAMTKDGTPTRHNTFIDIPDSLRLPHFMLADGKLDKSPDNLNLDYKMVLQSVVCHRGDCLQAGHYIAFARIAPKLLTDNRRHNIDPPPDYEEAQWVQFDDLQTEGRVTYVDDIRKALREEMPYLLFYQVLPMKDDACPSIEGGEAEPPSYSESRPSIELPPSPSAHDTNSQRTTGQAESYFDNASSVDTIPSSLSKPPSVRLSLETERRPRKSFEGVFSNQRSGSAHSDSGRPSMNVNDPHAISSAITTDGRMPPSSPNDESTATRLSRAATRFARGRHSRPSSQSGEGRFSKNRLGVLMKPGKDQSTEQTILSTSPGNLAVPVKSDVDDEIPFLEISSPPGPSPLTPQKISHGRGKSKDKPSKPKSNSQPDRECIVM